MKIIKKNNIEVMKLKKALNGVEYLSFNIWENDKDLIQGFSTRLGGVSNGVYASMNLSFSREPENKEGVLENYKRMAAALGVDTDSFVLSYQEHSVNIKVVGEADKGKGVLYERDYRNIDGLITNERGITLGAFFADCIPLYFYDKKRKVIGLAHSGWRGTCKKMGKVMLEGMKSHFNTEPCDVTACIGPGICQDCYQVSMDVYKEFSKEFSKGDMDMIFKPDGENHYKLDLWKANEIIIKDTGVPVENIHISNICTACNPDLLYSHRILGEKRGNMVAFIGLR